jgi:hypothetical protein
MTGHGQRESQRTVAGAPGLGRAPLVRSPVAIGAKIARAAAGRRSSNTATRQRRARRVNNRKSYSFSSEAFAGMRITYRHQKEAQPEGQHDDIQHEMLLFALVSGRDGCAFPGRKIAMDQEQ